MSAKVFVSSTIDGLTEERNLVREVITRLRMTPVMAEHDFASSPCSPRSACLDAVRSANIYLGILGPKYGSISEDTGLSPTHEEFEEARSRGIPIIWLFQDCERDKRQQAFANELSKWESGFFRTSFSSLHQLALFAMDALKSETETSGSNQRPTASLRDQFASHLAVDPHSGECTLAFYAQPRATKNIGDIFELESPQMLESLEHALLFGMRPLFDRKLAYDLQKHTDSIEYYQPPDGSLRTSLRVWPHGATLATCPAVGWNGPFESLSIDPRLYEASAARAIYTMIAVAQLIAKRRPTTLDAAITNPSSRRWGRRMGNSISYPYSTRQLANPLFATPESFALSVSDEPDEVAKRLTKHFERHYEIARLTSD